MNFLAPKHPAVNTPIITVPISTAVFKRKQRIAAGIIPHGTKSHPIFGRQRPPNSLSCGLLGVD